MIDVAVPGTAAPVILRVAVHWTQTSSGRRVGPMTRKHSRHHTPLLMQHLVTGLRQTAITLLCFVYFCTFPWSSYTSTCSVDLNY